VLNTTTQRPLVSAIGNANDLNQITAVGLTQGYGRTKVFEGLDLAFGTGVHGLLGPNGAGKTTLLRTLATIVPARAGALRVAGCDVHSERTARAARRQIGFLPQDFGYLPSYSALDFVRYCAWLRRVPNSTAKKASVEALGLVGLSEKANHKLGSFSGGMLRRAGIAAAIVGRPSVVLLDEPTVGLDPAQRLDFREMIRSLDDTTVILSTHLVEDVGAICDTVTVMTQGSVRFRGSPTELGARATGSVPGDSPLERGYMAAISPTDRLR
jgi:ABC-2 type transport system ATP-binding protein